MDLRRGARWLLLLLALQTACGADLPIEPVAARGAAVIGGAVAARDLHPAAGALISFAGARPRLLCTGALIAPTVVLTAAHCLLPLPEDLFFSLAPDAGLATRELSHRIGVVHVHPEFTTAPASNDIALALLDEPVPAVEPLPLGEAAGPLAPGSPVTLVGYGATSADGAGVGVRNDGQAQVAAVGTREIAIGGPGGVQNCAGDSGGPALIDTPEGARLVGVCSRSRDDRSFCSQGTIHTRVDAYLPWIAVTLAATPGCGCAMTPARRPGVLGEGILGLLLLPGLLSAGLRRRRHSCAKPVSRSRPGGVLFT